MRSDPLGVQLLVLAKTPVAGKVKTRLSPPLTPQGAADVAAAAIEDTLAAAREAPVARRVLVVDGPMTADGFDRQVQRGGALDERLAAAYDDAAAASDLPALLVGMDTPQITPALLETAARLLLRHEAVLGLSSDGGWWALGLRRPAGSLLLGVPTSLDDTGRLQAQRLHDAGLDVAALPVLSDVDTVDDAREVAALVPQSRFAAALGTALAAGQGNP